jgi:hypothetical protein
MIIVLIIDMVTIMKDNELWTTIAIRKTTHQSLKQLGKMGESYDDVIRRECKIGVKEIPPVSPIVVTGDPDGI